MADLPEDPLASALAVGDWEWDSVLDFSIGSPTAHILPWQSEELSVNLNEHVFPSQALGVPHAPVAQNSVPGNRSHVGDDDDEEDVESGRIRKRDPRLTCSNFLAGRVPCSCPEMEDNEEEELSRKRAKVIVARCQVPSCEADISQLKGYHRRHRVCLLCANAATVVLDDVSQRYCQQCGKFHLLTDFDEGKRSCRRKLERHNNRRRRKPANVVKASVQEQTLGAESALRSADAEHHNDGKSGQASKSFSSLGSGEKQASSGSEEQHISEVEQPYKDNSSLNNVGSRSADFNKVSSSSMAVNVSTELEALDMLQVESGTFLVVVAELDGLIKDARSRVRGPEILRFSSALFSRALLPAGARCYHIYSSQATIFYFLDIVFYSARSLTCEMSSFDRSLLY